MIEKIIGYILLICVSVFVGVMCALWTISSQIEPIDKQNLEEATRASYMRSGLDVELNYSYIEAYDPQTATHEFTQADLNEVNIQ